MVVYNGDVMKLTLKPAASTRVVTVAHSQDRVELLSQAKTHSNIYAATGEDHSTSNDIFKGITLKQHKVMQENLAKEKKVRERWSAQNLMHWILLRRGGGETTKLTSGNLSIPPVSPVLNRVKSDVRN